MNFCYSDHSQLRCTGFAGSHYILVDQKQLSEYEF